MSHIFAIARVTYREAVRNRVLYSLLFFVVVLIVVSAVLDQITFGQSGRVVLNMGLAGIHLFGVLIAVFLGVSLVSREIARKTLYVVLAKPVGRGAFLLGKYLGLLVTLALLVAVMGASVMAVAAAFSIPPTLSIAHAVLMIWAELALLSAVALLFAVFTGPFLSGMFTLGVFVVGHLSRGLKELGAASGDPMPEAFTKGLYYLFPDLEMLNFKREALYAVPVNGGDTALALLYAAAYSTAVLVVAVLIFRARDFK